MNILILGCSFGVPGVGCSAEYHTENQLKILGHTVYNFAECGSSNIASLERAKKFLHNNGCIRVDWVIWFHTELIRDLSDLLPSLNGTYYTFNEQIRMVYLRFAEFTKSVGAKIAVVGGAGPVHPTMFDYINPDFCIPSWFNDILDLNLPQIQTLSKLEIVEAMQTIGVHDKIKILEDHKEILDALEKSEDFPDNYHPGKRPHLELAQKLHSVIMGS